MSVRMLLCPEMILRPKVLFFRIDSINTRVCKHHIHASVKCKMKNYLLEWFVPLQCFKQWEFLDESSDECWQQSRIQICTAKNWKKRFLFHVKLPLYAVRPTVKGPFNVQEQNGVKHFASSNTPFLNKLIIITCVFGLKKFLLSRCLSWKATNWRGPSQETPPPKKKETVSRQVWYDKDPSPT